VTLILRLRITAPLNLQLRSTILTVKHIVYPVSVHYSEKKILNHITSASVLFRSKRDVMESDDS
jgi:hypothetical protein